MRSLFIEVVYRHSPVEMILWGVTAVALWTMIALLCKKNEKRLEAWIWVNKAGLLTIFLFIIKYTLLRESHKRDLSLIPFYSFTFPRTSDRYNTVVANALLFLPAGMNMPFVITSSSKKGWMREHPVSVSILASLFFSIVIEAAQFIFSLGLCETDDVIFNTLGAVMGTLSFVIFSYITNAKEKDNNP